MYTYTYIRVLVESFITVPYVRRAAGGREDLLR